jgi:ankyrin repeat protein
MGADPNARSIYSGRGNLTALMEAAAAASSDGDGDSDPGQTIDVLTEAGADVHARDENGNTALHWAATAETVEALIRHGADVNARNDAGKRAVSTSPPAPLR